MIDFGWLTQSFDLPVMGVLQGTESLFLDRLMLVLTFPYTWIPLYLTLVFAVIKNSSSFLHAALIIVFTLLAVGLTSLITDEVFKPSFMRYRPGRDMMLKYSIDVVNNYRSGKFGFVSAHASNTMTCVVFLSLVVRRRLFFVMLLAWSLLICYSRIYLGVHFPSDVLAGMLFGAVIGSVFYVLYSLVSSKLPALASKSASGRKAVLAWSCEDSYLIATVLLLLVLYAMFRAVFE